MNHVERYLEELRINGYALVPNVLDAARLADIRARLDAIHELDQRRFGTQALMEMREFGTLRFPMVDDRAFLELLNLQPVMEIVERVVGPTSILHLQNGIVLFPTESHQGMAFHRDFRVFMNDYAASVNAFLFIDDFTIVNGATQVVPFTHRVDTTPSQEFLEKHAVSAVGPAGSALLFDSKIFHRGGANRSDRPRRAVNMQFTQAMLRQQVDYAHCLPEEEYAKLPERTQQLLGRFVRLPKSSEEFRVPADRRLHRGGQF